MDAAKLRISTGTFREPLDGTPATLEPIWGLAMVERDRPKMATDTEDVYIIIYIYILYIILMNQ